MDRRFNRENSRDKGSITLHKKILESKRPNNATEPAPDLTDFMNDVFFGTQNTDKKAYNLTGCQDKEEETSFDDSIRSNSSRLTHEWLKEAKRIVASSPGVRSCDSPARLVGSPRFAADSGRHSSASILDRRDPLSRSARRYRPSEGVSGEILTKSVKHGFKKSGSLDSTPNTPTDSSPASQVHKWFTNILKPPNPSNPGSKPSSPCQLPDPPISPSFEPTAPTLPPRLSIHRKSRFQTTADQHFPAAATPQDIPVPPRRSFKPAPLPTETTQLLSPPKNLIESAQRRSISSSTCSQPGNRPLFPPGNLVVSAHRRSISKNTCSIENAAPTWGVHSNGWHKEEIREENLSLNAFLKEQKTKIEKVLNRELDSKAKVILSGPSNRVNRICSVAGTSSIIAAICYAWMLENRDIKNKGGGEECVVVPVMNVRRGKMWWQRQSAWLFHHVGLDANSLLFANEVDLESLMMAGKLNMLVVGQDILKTNAEVGSQCTILTDNYCENAYDLLQTPMLKKLLLAGILLDTQNLNSSETSFTTRDVEAVQLLLVGLSPNYGNALFEQLKQDQRDNSFFEALRQNYGKPPTESENSIWITRFAVAAQDYCNQNGWDYKAQVEQKETERKSASVSSRDTMTQNTDKKSNDARNSRSNNRDEPTSAKQDAKLAPPAAAPAASDASRGKNKFFLAQWFNWGSK